MEDELEAEEEMLEDLSEDVKQIEEEFEKVSGGETDESLRRKQQQAREILEEIHEQLDFLKDVAEEAGGDRKG
ncbi:MAG: hypothetical protein ABEI58_02700 [Candidatus Nanohaloarchaea archaeon]